MCGTDHARGSLWSYADLKETIPSSCRLATTRSDLATYESPFKDCVVARFDVAGYEALSQVGTWIEEARSRIAAGFRVRFVVVHVRAEAVPETGVGGGTLHPRGKRFLIAMQSVWTCTGFVPVF